MVVHRFAEEDVRLDVVDGPPERVSVEVVADVSDGMAVRLWNRVGVVVDMAPVAKVEKP